MTASGQVARFNGTVVQPNGDIVVGEGLVWAGEKGAAAASAAAPG